MRINFNRAASNNYFECALRGQAKNTVVVLVGLTGGNTNYAPAPEVLIMSEAFLNNIQFKLSACVPWKSNLAFGWITLAGFKDWPEY